MSGIEITSTELNGVKLLSSLPHVDERGSFSRLFCEELLPFDVKQINLSTNKKRGTLRGLHFQKEPHAEEKVILCLKGKLFDVIVNLESGEHVSYELTPGLGLLAPKGHAHGFLTLEDDTELLYLCSVPYHAPSAFGIYWNDPALKINWPFEPVVISEADQNRIKLEELHALPIL